VGSLPQTFAVVRDADDVGMLSTDVKNFALEAKAIAFMRALRKMQ
jgi:hypothetical protein